MKRVGARAHGEEGRDKIKDSLGLSVEGAGQSDVEAVDSFREGLLAMEGGLEGILEAAESAPGCALLQTYAAIFYLYAGTAEGNRTAQSWMVRARSALTPESHRERRILEALHLWHEVDYESAMDALEALTEEWPQDFVAVKVCEFLYYLTGQHYQALRFRAHLERIVGHTSEHPDVLAMYAFSLELSGEYEAARLQAERAIDLRFSCAWAHHALGHISIVQNELERGRREQEKFLPTWNKPGASIHGHNAWHLALFRLQAGDESGVMALFRSTVWGHAPQSLGEQVDAISLLWRMEMADLSVPEEIWSDVAQACVPFCEEILSPFVAAHHAYVFARWGHDQELSALDAAVARAAHEQPSDRRLMWQEVGIPVIEASAAWGRRDRAGVVRALQPFAHEIPRVGGSDAQDDLFRLTLLKSLQAMGRLDSRARLLKLFPGKRPMEALV